MGTRARRLLTEVGRFLAVGGVATLVSLLLFNLLVHGGGAPLADDPVLAYVAANTVGMLVGYQGNRWWVFRHRPPVDAVGGFGAYVVINLATMTLPVACLLVSREVLGLDDPVSDNVAANVVGLALGVGARFWLFRRFVFKRPVPLLDVPAELAAELAGDPWPEERPEGSQEPKGSEGVSPPRGPSTPRPDRPAARGAAGG
jgi:putative flippase GtrA